MEIDSLSFLLGVTSAIIAYILGSVAGFLGALWKSGQIDGH